MSPSCPVYPLHRPRESDPRALFVSPLTYEESLASRSEIDASNIWDCSSAFDQKSLLFTAPEKMLLKTYELDRKDISLYSNVFVPSSTKVLHLYEARFLALLEEVMGKYDNLFAHIVIEPMSTSGQDEESKGVASFIATYGCLARIEKVKRLEIGAEVTIRGIGRIKLIGLTQLEPFLKGTIVSLKDETPKNAEELGSAIEDLRTTLSTIQQLQIKLKVSDDELLQTPLERALHWAEEGEPDQVADLYLPSWEERVSFAALQPVAGANAAEQHKLLQERLYAMESMDTLQRLKRVRPFAQQTIASLAAKLSIQSLNL